MIDSNRYIIHYNKDNRMVAYDKVEKRNISYPRLIMEDFLNRKLLKNEHVHHIDCNPLNNDISNLQVMTDKEHIKYHHKILHYRNKYFDKTMTCPVCKNDFIWTAKQQKRFQSNKHNTEKQNKQKYGPFCSNRCAGVFTESIQKSNKETISIEEQILINLIYETMIYTNGSSQKTSKILGIPRSTITYKLIKAGLPSAATDYK